MARNTTNPIPIRNKALQRKSLEMIQCRNGIQIPSHLNMSNMLSPESWSAGLIYMEKNSSNCLVPNMPSGSAPASQFAIPVDEYLKINNLETTYSGSNNPVTIADIATGALYFVARALGATTSSVVCNLTSRVRYTD